MFIYSVKIVIIWLFLQIIGDNMAKAPKTAYVCNDCGAEYSKWMGQCKECLRAKFKHFEKLAYKKCQDLAVAFKN